MQKIWTKQQEWRSKDREEGKEVELSVKKLIWMHACGFYDLSNLWIVDK